MPRTGTTLCHPKIDYVDLTRNPALDTLALNSPLDHFNGDNTRLSTRRTKTMVTLKKQSLTRPTTHAAISNFSTSHNSISSQYSQPFTSLAAQKQTQYSMLQIKTLFQKYISTFAILLIRHSTFITLKTLRGE